MPLSEYVMLHFSGNQSEFARHMGVSRQKVNGWVADGWIVVDGKLYSPRRDIPVIIEAHQ
jgi:DNA-binding transcriptional regulator YdaS (Cro superfamily)